ncbi:MAG: hypothetical protein BVN34_09135 [Proteobacteria bacterium ST_bin12]|nr:MAG: hypothetical protein BVN34_09135 [Proteobacteria bacterium ST_bin12]
MQKAQNILKGLVSSKPKKSVVEPVSKVQGGDLARENSIFNQQKLICLSKIDLEKVQIALMQIAIARDSLVSAMAALQGFEGISKRDLLIAANMAHGYDYMLQEFLHQSRGGLKHENFNLGLVKKS